MDYNSEQMAGVKKTNEDKKNQTMIKVISAINNLRESGKPLTVTQIAEEADVSRKTIYANPDILDAIKKYSTDYQYKKNRDTEAKDIVIEQLQLKNKKLNKALEKALKRLEKLEQLEEELDKIKKENKCLKEEIASLYARQ